MANSKTCYFYDDSSLAYIDEEPLCIMTCDSPCTECLRCVEEDF